MGNIAGKSVKIKQNKKFSPNSLVVTVEMGLADFGPA